MSPAAPPLKYHRLRSEKCVPAAVAAPLTVTVDAAPVTVCVTVDVIAAGAGGTADMPA
jgi:hypothetical protein